MNTDLASGCCSRTNYRAPVPIRLVLRCSGLLVWLLLATGVPGSAASACIDYTDYLRWHAVIDTGNNPALGVDAHGSYLYVANRTSVRVIDLQAGGTVGSYAVGGGYAVDLVVEGSYAYVAAYAGGLRVLDVSNPSTPTQIGMLDTPDNVHSVAVAGDVAYLASGNDGLYIIDVSNPASPALISSVDTDGIVSCVATNGLLACFGDSDRRKVYVVDVSIPSQPLVRSVIQLDGQPEGIAIDGHYAYVASGDLEVFDIAEPATPVHVASLQTPGTAWGVSVEGDHAYIADGTGFVALDVVNPTAPLITGRLATGDTARNVAIDGGFAYLAVSDAGVYIAGIGNASSPGPVGQVSLAGTADDVAVEGLYAYVTKGDSGRLYVVDAIDPTAPVVVGQVEIPGYAHGVAAAGGYAYVAADRDGLVVVDVVVPTAPIVVGQVEWPTWPAEEIAVEGQYAYVVDVNGLVVIDVSAPTAPVVMSRLSLSSISAYGVAARGSYAYVSSGGALQVVDVADPTAPVLIGTCALPGAPFGIDLQGDYAYVACQFGGLAIIDVSDPAHPSLSGSVDTPGIAADVKVEGPIAYVADGSGVQVVDCFNLSNPGVLGTSWVPGATSSVGNVVISAGWIFCSASTSGMGLLILPVQCGSPIPPEPFSLLSPADAETLLTTAPALSWERAHDTDSGDTVRYAVYWSRNSGFAPADSAEAGPDTTYAIGPSTLFGGATYYWKVRAWDTDGITRWSDPAAGWSFYTPQITPIGLSLQAQSSDSGILLTWSVPVDMRALGFTVYRRVAGTDDWLGLSPVLHGEGATVTYVDDHAEPGVRYEYEVEVLGTSGPAGRWGTASAELPAARLWLGVSPNPGRTALTVNFGMTQAGIASLRLFDSMGREVAREVMPWLRVGNHRVDWMPGDEQLRRLPSGAYWVRLETPGGSRTARWTALR